MTGLFLVLATFLASAVEAVEALTIVLATGVTRGWRSSLIGVGAAIASRMIELGWVRRAQRSRAVHVSDDGYTGLRQQFGIELSPNGAN